jgi:hypothetical protein
MMVSSKVRRPAGDGSAEAGADEGVGPAEGLVEGDVVAMLAFSSLGEIKEPEPGIPVQDLNVGSSAPELR